MFRYRYILHHILQPWICKFIWKLLGHNVTYTVYTLQSRMLWRPFSNLFRRFEKISQIPGFSSLFLSFYFTVIPSLSKVAGNKKYDPFHSNPWAGKTPYWKMTSCSGCLSICCATVWHSFLRGIMFQNSAPIWHMFPWILLTLSVRWSGWLL